MFSGQKIIEITLKGKYTRIKEVDKKSKEDSGSILSEGKLFSAIGNFNL